jgi:perosamine synthetase
VDGREALMAKLAAAGIESSVHYPVALPAMEAYRYLSGQQPTPRALENSRRILSLPIYPEQSREMIEYVVRTLAQALQA